MPAYHEIFQLKLEMRTRAEGNQMSLRHGFADTLPTYPEPETRASGANSLQRWGGKEHGSGPEDANPVPGTPHAAPRPAHRATAVLFLRRSHRGSEAQELARISRVATGR